MRVFDPISRLSLAILPSSLSSSLLSFLHSPPPLPAPSKQPETKLSEEERIRKEEEAEEERDTDHSDPRGGNRSCCCLWRDSTYRKLNKRLAENKLFEGFILVCIGMSTVSLGIDR